MRHHHRPFTMGIALLGAALFVGLGHLPSAQADSFTFTGHGVDPTSWHDPANWRPNGVPSAGDDVSIHRQPGGPVRVTLADEVLVNALDLGEGGSLAGSGMTIVSRMTWTGGAFLTTNVTLSPGSVTFVSGADKKLLENSTINNGGVFTFTDGTITFDAGAGLNNTGTLTASHGITFTGLVCCAGPNLMPINTPGRFVVTPLSVSNPSGTVTVSNLAFNASGTVEVQSGVLDLQIGPSHLAGGVSFTGAGRTRISQFTARNVTVHGPVNLASDSTFELAHAAALGGTGTFTGGGTFNWTDGEINGAITIDAGTALLINGPADKVLRQDTGVPPGEGGTLTNAGTGLFTGPSRLVFSGPAVLHNAGMFTAQAGATFFTGGCCLNPPALTNSGTFVSDPGDTGTVTLSGGVALTNSGRLSVTSGTLQINLIGYQQTAGSTLVAGGTLVSDRTIVIRGGQLLGTGTVKASLSNAGTVRPGPLRPLIASGLLTVAGDYTQTVTGTLQVNINGSTVGTGYNRLAVTGAATLAGALAITSTATLPEESTLGVLTCAACTGVFGRVSGTAIPGGGSYTVQYLPTGVNLVVTAAASCGDQRDELISLYKTFPVIDSTSGQPFTPTCDDFTQTAHTAFFSFAELNVDNTFDWALLRTPLLDPVAFAQGLDTWRKEYGGPRHLTSAYRNPQYNHDMGGDPHSRHLFGDAADLRNETGSLEEWIAMKQAALRSAADWTEPLNGPCQRNCFHADWRCTPGSYK